MAADNVLDLGPGAGEHGGNLIFAGTRDAMLADPQSLTGRYLRGDLRIAGAAATPEAARKISEDLWARAATT